VRLLGGLGVEEVQTNDKHITSQWITLFHSIEKRKGRCWSMSSGDESSGRIEVREKEILKPGRDRKTVTRTLDEPPGSTIKRLVNISERGKELVTRRQRSLDGIKEEVKRTIDRSTNDIGVLTRMQHLMCVEDSLKTTGKTREDDLGQGWL